MSEIHGFKWNLRTNHKSHGRYIELERSCKSGVCVKITVAKAKNAPSFGYYNHYFTGKYGDDEFIVRFGIGGIPVFNDQEWVDTMQTVAWAKEKLSGLEP